MPVNSSALIRFQVYDKCLRSLQKGYTREAIIKELRKVEVRERKNSEERISREGIEVRDRQFYKDIKAIEDIWGIEIERVNRGKSKIYRYRHPEFSMFSHLPKDNDLIKLRDTLFVLQQFRGLPHFNFLSDLLDKIEGPDNNTKNQNIIVDFDGNPDLQGLNYFSTILASIQMQKVLKISYWKSFKYIRRITISPYFLKEYNNRWFLLGTEKDYSSISTLALDRIRDIEHAENEKYISTEQDFAQDYFENVIGVTIPKNSSPVDVVLRFAKDRFAYVSSKPLHGSQKTYLKENVVKINVILNKELESLIMHYGEDVEVLEPDCLRTTIMKRITSMQKKYMQKQ